MKPNFILIFLIGCFCSCESKVLEPEILQCSVSELKFGVAMESQSFRVTSNEKWTVKCDAEDNWIAYAISDDTITVTATENTGQVERKCNMLVESNTLHVTIPVSQDKPIIEITAPDGYHLVWHDEFTEGTTLSGDWTHEVKGNYFFNQELQTYVDGEINGKRVTELKDGYLNINCFMESGKVYSGRVYAKKNEGWKYGYFEASIQLPQGKGSWPAFWMMPVYYNYNTGLGIIWPDCGEIDIMEEIGADPNIVHSTIHCEEYNHTLDNAKSAMRNIPTAESAFHVYACEWTEDHLRFFVDGEELMTYDNEGTGRDSWPFTDSFHIILNLAWGGSWGGYKGVDNKALPITMSVDYVRVFQKSAGN